MIDIIKIIKDHKENCEKEGKVPSYITYTELQSAVLEQVREKLNESIKNGELVYGNTINDRWIAIND